MGQRLIYLWPIHQNKNLKHLFKLITDQANETKTNFRNKIYLNTMETKKNTAIIL